MIVIARQRIICGCNETGKVMLCGWVDSGGGPGSLSLGLRLSLASALAEADCGAARISSGNL